MKRRKIIFGVFTGLLFLGVVVVAQPGQPPHHPPGHGLPGDQKPHDTPIGKGLGVLSLMALTYTVKKVRKKGRNQPDSS